MRDLNRVLWNERQQTLRQALSGKGDEPGVFLFLDQHAMAHAEVVFGGAIRHPSMNSFMIEMVRG
jgi:hypothetical protein